MESTFSLKREPVDPTPRVRSPASCQCMELKIQLCCSPGSQAVCSARGVGVFHLQGAGYGSEAVQAIQAAVWMRGPLLAFILLGLIMSAHADSRVRPLALSIKAGNEALDDLSVLDPRIQSITFQSFNGRRIKTGVVYNVTLPEELAGLTVQAVRLRTGSLRNRGFTFNEFVLPKGVVVTPYLERVVLVYRNLGNVTAYSPSIPAGYDSGPVIGILVYSAANLNTTEELQELSLAAPPSQQPILIQFRVPEASDRSRCAALNKSSPTTRPVVAKNQSPGSCSTYLLGDFTLLLPRPSSSSDTWKKIVAGIVGGGVGLALIVLLALLAVLLWQRSRIQKMHKAADQGPTLQTALIGNSRAPAAAATRTGPTLENDYVV